MNPSHLSLAAEVAIANLPRPSFVNEADPHWQQIFKVTKLSIEEYQRLKGVLMRSPTLTELGVFAAMWSEHCSYKSSRIHLKRLPTEGQNVVVGPGENAGVVRLFGKICVAFKMESHNHPSYIEPYQGASTGVGGIMRDVFCMGARPVANLNCLRFGAKTHPKTAHLFEEVCKGVGDYGNSVGIPTVGGNISFDACYNGNCLVNAFTAGLIHEDRIFKGFASGEGNLIVYVGSATGRDGIHGATMASDSFVSAEKASKSAVQVGDPFAEKLLLETTLECLSLGLVVGLQDMGAAGLSSSAFEMAGRAGHGIAMDLNCVPVRAESMTAYEIMLSESQERMLMVVTPENWLALKMVLERWGLAFNVIGHVTNTGRVQIVYNGKLEVDIPVGPLTEQAPKYERALQPSVFHREPGLVERAALQFVRSHGISGTMLGVLAKSGCKEPVYQQYDRHIGYRSVLESEQGGAAVLWVHSEWNGGSEKPYLGLVLSSACNERYCESDPKLGAAHAVAKAARMIAATGGEPLAATDCLNYGNPEDPQVMAQLSAGVDGITEACLELAIPVVSGNVSLYNETDGKSIYPTPMIGMVGRHDDVRLAVPAVIRSTGVLALLLSKHPEFSFGGSLVASLAGMSPEQMAPPAIAYAHEREAFAFLRKIANSGHLAAARDLGVGGLAGGLAKMSRSSGLKVNINLEVLSSFGLAKEVICFAELSGAYVLQLNSNQHLNAAMGEAKALQFGQLIVIGDVTEGVAGITIDGETTTQAALASAANEFLSLR